jgi:preprotein translocase subunit YajC
VIYSAFLLLQQSRNPLFGPIFMYGAIFAIFYLILIRPQQKQRKLHDRMIRALKKGDEVVTVGGVIGEVLHIRETVSDGAAKPTMEDRVTIKSGESRLLIERGRIAKVLRSAGTAPSTGS